MKPVGAQQCRHQQALSQKCDTRISTRIKATDEQLDAAIMAALSEAGGEVVAWADLRQKLPTASYWRKVAALVRLHQSGRLSAFKVAGRNYVDPIVMVAP